jgi:iron complex transport system substrate-binding protein
MTSRSLFRPTRSVAALAAAATLALGVVACSDDDSDSASTTGAAASDSSDSSDSSDDQGTWPREVDSVVVNNGQAGKETEKVEIPAKPEKIVSTSVTLTGSLLAVDAPVVASGGAKAGPTSDDKGFFSQWADKADEKGVKALWQLQPDLQKVAAEDPDLIIVSAKGADTAAPQIDELKKIGAPVLVLDYSDKTWNDITTELGEATGHEKDAADAIKSYEDRVAEVKENIKEPEQPVNFAFLAQTGKDLNFETDESAQGRILADLGWEVAVPDASLVSDEYKGRPDVKQVTEEHLDKALVGKTALVSSAGNPNPAEAVKAIPTVQNTDVVKNDRVFQLKPDVFRIDYYSALSMLDQIEELFKK